MNWRIIQGDALERLRELPERSVQACITSPPGQALALIRPWLSPHKIAQADEAITAREEYEATPVPPRRRKQFCVRGHDLSETRYVAPGGGSYCRMCAVVRQREGRRQRRDDAPLFNWANEVAA